MTDGRVSDLEFEWILSKRKRYKTLKQDLRHKTKKKTEAITNNQQEAILSQGREEGRNAFFKTNLQILPLSRVQIPHKIRVTTAVQ